VHCMWSKFGVDSSSRFAFRARTHRQTDKPYGHYASRRRSGKNSRCYN